MIASHGSGIWELVGCTASIGLILGHNLWLIAKGRRQSKGEPLRLEVHVGHHFPVGESAIKPERLAEFLTFTTGNATPVENLHIDGVALVAEVGAMNAQMAALVVLPRSITLEAGSFANYINEEDAASAVAPEFQAGVTVTPQHEVYSKYAKVLLSAETGNERASCQAAGHIIEIMPELDPTSLRAGGRLPVRVLFDGAPLTGVRVSSSCDQAERGGYLAHARTDADGRAVLDLDRPGHWCLRSHYIRRHPDPQTAQWESFWPSLTFHIPE